MFSAPDRRQLDFYNVVGLDCKGGVWCGRVCVDDVQRRHGSRLLLLLHDAVQEPLCRNHHQKLSSYAHARRNCSTRQSLCLFTARQVIVATILSGLASLQAWAFEDGCQHGSRIHNHPRYPIDHKPFIFLIHPMDPKPFIFLIHPIDHKPFIFLIHNL